MEKRFTMGHFSHSDGTEETPPGAVKSDPLGIFKEEEPQAAFWPMPISPDLLILFLTVWDLPGFYKTWMREQAKLN